MHLHSEHSFVASSGIVMRLVSYLILTFDDAACHSLLHAQTHMEDLTKGTASSISPRTMTKWLSQVKRHGGTGQVSTLATWRITLLTHTSASRMKRARIQELWP